MKTIELPNRLVCNWIRFLNFHSIDFGDSKWIDIRRLDNGRLLFEFFVHCQSTLCIRELSRFIKSSLWLRQGSAVLQAKHCQERNYTNIAHRVVLLKHRSPWFRSILELACSLTGDAAEYQYFTRIVCHPITATYCKMFRLENQFPQA